MRKYLMAMSATAGLLALGGVAAPAAQAQAAGGEQPPSGVVSATPASGTPHLNATADSPVQQIKQLVECGGNMYAVGSFTEIQQGSTTYDRANIFSFKATSPYTVTSFAPKVVGGTTSSASDALDSIAFVGGNCADAYIAGNFTSVNGTSVKNIAEISTSTGDVVSGFGHTANGVVETLVGFGDHVLAGGYFTSINDSTADAYMASLNPATGKNDGFVGLHISGNYEFHNVSPNSTRVYNQALSHGGTLDLVMGDFTSVGGQSRQQIFMLNLAGATATVTGWTSPQFDGNCATVEPYYVQAAAWSPSDSEVYIGTTGYHPDGKPVGKSPRTGLCDAAAAFPATQTSVSSTWINYTGCDSLYAAAADSSGAYFAGHERYSMNSDDCDALGTGGYNAPGMEGLDPANGNLYLNSAGTAGHYSRGRGLGADDMLVTSGGLWIASDNLKGTQECGGKSGLAGICFLPYN